MTEVTLNWNKKFLESDHPRGKAISVFRPRGEPSRNYIY